MRARAILLAMVAIALGALLAQQARYSWHDAAALLAVGCLIALVLGLDG